MNAGEVGPLLLGVLTMLRYLVTLRSSLLASLVLFAGCKCAAPSLGPLEDAKPASLGDTGLVVEQPADGATIDAEWVTVTGWVDRSRYPFVAVVGAPHEKFYAATGHVGPAERAGADAR